MLSPSKSHVACVASFSVVYILYVGPIGLAILSSKINKYTFSYKVPKRLHYLYWFSGNNTIIRKYKKNILHLISSCVIY